MDVFTTKQSGHSFTPYDVKGYHIVKPLLTTNAGNCKWGFAKKNGKEFFIKEFLSPKFPDSNADMYKSTRDIIIHQCEEWFSCHEKVYHAILKCGGSNLIYPIDFFLDKNTYYLVTEKVDACDVDFNQLYMRCENQKSIILKVLANEISCLADKRIVHSDLKPENLILKATVSDFFTVKIIDFDASFFECMIPDPEDIVGDQVYYSPEMLMYVEEEEGSITCKSDVFALGIIFHKVLTGKIPKYSCDYRCLGEAVLNGEFPLLSSDLQPFYKDLIHDMLILDVDERISAKEVKDRLLNKDQAIKLNSINNKVIIKMK